MKLESVMAGSQNECLELICHLLSENNREVDLRSIQVVQIIGGYAGIPIEYVVSFETYPKE